MISDLRKILRFFQLKRIMIPIVIGLGVAAWLIIRDLDMEHLSGVKWSGYMVGWLLAAICLQAIRDIAYMYRIRLMTDKQISWRHSFDVIMLWEFASSITPSVVGGSAIALIIVHKEGISVGKSTAIVLVTAMLDELFYILMVPVILLLIGTRNLFISSQSFLMNWGSEGVFIAGYVFILFLTTIITYAIFLNPRGFKWILLKVFKLRILKRWRYDAARTGDDIITTSREMKGKSWKFWLKAYGATVFSWTARFWVVNCLILAFNPAVQDQLLIYGRQLVMWVILLISPTPGSSGIAEYAFPMFLGEFIPQGFEAAVGLLWRILSYYPYLVIGVIVLPFWIRRVFLKRKLIRFRSV